MYAKHYENPTMLSKVTAKNVRDVFLRHTVVSHNVDDKRACNCCRHMTSQSTLVSVKIEFISDCLVLTCHVRSYPWISHQNELSLCHDELFKRGLPLG